MSKKEFDFYILKCSNPENNIKCKKEIKYKSIRHLKDFENIKCKSCVQSIKLRYEMSKRKLGVKPPHAGKKGYYSLKTLKKMSDAKSGKTYEQIFGEEKGKELRKLKSIQSKKQNSDKTNKWGGSETFKVGGYKPNSIKKHKRGKYKGYWCDSSWELAFVVYNLDHNIEFQRNTKLFPYEYENKIKNYIPDFILEDGTYIEIKGYVSEEVKAKIKHFPLKLTLLDKLSIKPYLDYMINIYGKNFISLYETTKYEK